MEITPQGAVDDSWVEIIPQGAVDDSYVEILPRRQWMIHR